jgi:hypothetical protein
MNEDSFNISQHTVEFENTSDPWYLLPFGDIHFGNPNCHEELFEDWCDWARGKKRTIFIGMGDYQEWFSESERQGMNAVRLHQSSKKTLDDIAKDAVEKFCKKIKFMKGKLLGFIEGNHFYVFENGMTSTQLVCQMLGCKYLGATALSRITFPYTKTNQKHGWTASVDVPGMREAVPGGTAFSLRSWMSGFHGRNHGPAMQKRMMSERTMSPPTAGRLRRRRAHESCQSERPRAGSGGLAGGSGFMR